MAAGRGRKMAGMEIQAETDKLDEGEGIVKVMASMGSSNKQC